MAHLRRAFWAKFAALLLAVVLATRVGAALPAILSLNLGMVDLLFAAKEGQTVQREAVAAKARQRLEQAAAAGSSSSSLWFAQGLAAELMGDQPAAQRAWQANPESYQIFFAKAALEQREQRLQEAIRWFNRALLVQPNDIEAQIRLGKLYHDLGAYAEALPYLQYVVATHSAPSEVYAQLCDIYRGLGQLNAAHAVYEQALQARANENAHLQLCIGKVYWDQQAYDQAACFLQRAIVQSPIDPTAHFWLSLVLNRLGQITDAITEAEEALRLAPNRVDYLEHLTNLYITVEQWQKVQQTVDRIAVLAPENPKLKQYLEMIPAGISNAE